MASILHFLQHLAGNHPTNIAPSSGFSISGNYKPGVWDYGGQAPQAVIDQHPQQVIGNSGIGARLAGLKPYVAAQGSAVNFRGGNLGIPNEQNVQNWTGNPGQGLQGVENPGLIPLQNSGYGRGPLPQIAGGNFQLPPVTQQNVYPTVPWSKFQPLHYMKQPQLQPLPYLSKLGQ